LLGVQCSFTHAYPTGSIRWGPPGAKVGLFVVRCSYLLTSPSRSFSAAGHTVLVFDYFLTLNDEVRLSSDIMMHTAEDIPFITDLVHLECSLDMGEDHVPY
jgi:hypothetical protein